MVLFVKELIRLVSNRTTSSQPSIRTAVGVVVASMAILIVLAILLTPSGQEIRFHFIEENGLITVASAFLLAAAATLSFAVQTTEKRFSKEKTWPWLLLSVGFTFLSVDEVFQIHEKLGGMMDSISAAGPFRSWNTALVVLYGFIAVPIGWMLLPHMLKVRSMPELMVTAFLLYTVHTLTDNLVTESSNLTHIVEESFKLFCSGFLALSAYAAFVWSASNVSGRR